MAMASTSSSVKKESEVWKYFSKTEDGVRAKCSLCFKTLKCTGNTTNFIQHLVKVHSKRLDTLRPKRKLCTSTNDPSASITSQGLMLPLNLSPSIVPEESTVTSSPTISEYFNNIRGFNSGGYKAESVTKDIVLFLIKDNRPAATIAGEGFQNLIKHAYPHYQIPHPTTIKRKIDTLFPVAKEYIKKKFSIVNNFACTFDIWTDPMTVTGYLGLTLHFILNYQHFSYVIAVNELNDGHTAVYLSHILEEIFNSWEISKEKIVACVTDNGANVVKAVELFFGKDKHITCFAHCLNLVVKSSINDASGFMPIILKLKNIVTFFHKSTSATTLLKKEQEKQGEPVLKLIQDVSTRWNSTFQMIERFLLIKGSVTIVLQNSQNAPEILSCNEINILKEALIILKPFFLVTSEMSSEKHTTISKVIPFLGLLDNKLNMINVESCIGIQLKKMLLLNLQKRFKHVESTLLYSVSTILDPRFKKCDFKNRSACAHAINFVNNYFQKIPMVDYCVEYEDEIIHNDNDLWASRSVNIVKHKNEIENLNTGLHSNLKTYLNTAIESHTVNPLDVWEKMEKFYPVLGNLALTYLVPPATSVPAERLFSKAGNIMTEKRSRLKSKHLEKVLILSSLSMRELKSFC